MTPDIEHQFPALFGEKLWPWGPTRASFGLLDGPPPFSLIANVNLVPTCQGDWVQIRLGAGQWDLPGGTLEPGEGYMDTIRRELMEEAGAKLLSFRLFGAWRCLSLATRPYRPHLPHPEYYRLVGVGEIDLVGSPSNPAGSENVQFVEATPLEIAVRRFKESRRDDLADLYRLAARIIEHGG